MNDNVRRGGSGARAPGKSELRALLLLTGAAVTVWLLGVGILVQQRLAGGPTYAYWLETTVSAALITPIAVLLVLRRPDHRLSRLYAGFVGTGAVQLFSGAAATALTGRAPATAAWFAALHEAVQAGFVVLLMTLVLLYPTGHLPGRRWRPVAWSLGLGGSIVIAMGAVAPRFGNFVALENPLAFEAPWVETAGTAGAAFLVLGVLGSITSSVFRYRRSAGLERLQLKWFTFAVVSGVVLLVGLDRFLPSDSVYGSILWTFVPSAVLASIGVAVFRYRLLEIDRIISRTVSYALVSALLVALYGLSVVILTPLLARLGGGSNIAVAAATLVVAAAFGPVRRRVQSVIDRRFDRGRYDAERTVEAFASGLRDKVDLDQLSDHLVEVVGGTVAPRQVVLWLSDPQARVATGR